MRTVLKLSLLCGLLVLAAHEIIGPVHASPFDNVKSTGKKNDKWFASNRQKITGQITGSELMPATNVFGGHEQLQALRGWVENKSDQPIAAVVFDVIIRQPGTGAEALKERVWLCNTVFMTEKANFRLGRDSTSASQIFECLGRNTNYTMSGNIVAAIPQSLTNDPGDLQEYYQVKSIWCRTK